ncbi:hypothetical protein DFP72DRAFT_1074298 [Ephemerocybe angulata]|uniref:Uncharacterized protein n=1 Tax=Ephemerocybe angulata TaxID=980116 RepID=A0A8H6HJX7_9AGAR|nr:hypothetical protein DFP72DRAFT_1074298 [Tulosesus angulatus]
MQPTTAQTARSLRKPDMILDVFLSGLFFTLDISFAIFILTLSTALPYFLTPILSDDLHEDPQVAEYLASIRSRRIMAGAWIEDDVIDAHATRPTSNYGQENAGGNKFDADGDGESVPSDKANTDDDRNITEIDTSLRIIIKHRIVIERVFVASDTEDEQNIMDGVASDSEDEQDIFDDNDDIASHADTDEAHAGRSSVLATDSVLSPTSVYSATGAWVEEQHKINREKQGNGGGDETDSQIGGEEEQKGGTESGEDGQEVHHSLRVVKEKEVPMLVIIISDSEDEQDEYDTNSNSEGASDLLPLDPLDASGRMDAYGPFPDGSESEHHPDRDDRFPSGSNGSDIDDSDTNVPFPSGSGADNGLSPKDSDADRSTSCDVPESPHSPFAVDIAPSQLTAPTRVPSQSTLSSIALFALTSVGLVLFPCPINLGVTDNSIASTNVLDVSGATSDGSLSDIIHPVAGVGEGVSDVEEDPASSYTEADDDEEGAADDEEGATVDDGEEGAAVVAQGNDECESFSDTF